MGPVAEERTVTRPARRRPAQPSPEPVRVELEPALTDDPAARARIVEALVELLDRAATRKVG